MPKQRNQGQVHPGYQWGPFTARIPLIHTRVEWPELVQGSFITTSIGFALVPILQASFGLSFNEALAMCFIHALLIYWSPILFGEPFSPGWTTPALPFVLAFSLSTYDSYDERFQAMTAMSLDFALLVGVLGITGLGKKFVELIPLSVKAGVLLGASLAALDRIFVADWETYLSQPIAMTLALALCIIVAFSHPFIKLCRQHSYLAFIGSYGLLPALVVAAIAGYLIGELKFDLAWGFTDLPFVSLWQKVSPFYIGWPSLDMFIEGLPIVFIAYIATFGDLITGTELIKDAAPSRPDEKVLINNNRSHLALAVRNVLMALTSPFFSTQGFLWTGTQVIVLKRWREGRAKMDSIYSGISSFYLLGFPVFFFFLPAITLLTPLMKIALALTLTLTAFGCASIAIRLVSKSIQMGVALITAFSLVTFNMPWVGILVGVMGAILLIGIEDIQQEREADEL